MGLLTVQQSLRMRRSGFVVQVWLDGEDVTSRCFACDDVAGWAALYVLNDQGKHQLTEDRSRTLTETRHGRVRYVWSY